jgi:hypothetical protein
MDTQGHDGLRSTCCWRVSIAWPIGIGKSERRRADFFAKISPPYVLAKARTERVERRHR